MTLGCNIQINFIKVFNSSYQGKSRLKRHYIYIQLMGTDSFRFIFHRLRIPGRKYSITKFIRHNGRSFLNNTQRSNLEIPIFSMHKKGNSNTRAQSFTILTTQLTIDYNTLQQTNTGPLPSSIYFKTNWQSSV
jgi:hypothetical protein